jgi:hypothetical protein
MAFPPRSTLGFQHVRRLLPTALRRREIRVCATMQAAPVMGVVKNGAGLQDPPCRSRLPSVLAWFAAPGVAGDDAAADPGIPWPAAEQEPRLAALPMPIAGARHLLSVGDLVDRGADSRQALDLLIRLEREAEAAGGPRARADGQPRTRGLRHRPATA